MLAVRGLATHFLCRTFPSDTCPHRLAREDFPYHEQSILSKETTLIKRREKKGREKERKRKRKKEKKATSATVTASFSLVD